MPPAPPRPPREHDPGRDDYGRAPGAGGEPIQPLPVGRGLLVVALLVGLLAAWVCVRAALGWPQ